ncbi:NAD(P)/FAD-dependent oxidoreductase [Novosphingobium mangrovi (ex Huang et al. 2023)]|uniref:FAD-binding oxidoreductase n=1 Tax=Novosphingobium mangrovi (ex Huang et al. 2023) TaxID=2976432 RepID=A0ABT2I4E7_9SPHN|nr:FAD-binding oxidoreductase [Novosphingobium mangrovi (ex Huang et al. 2023)]MCT2399655.1 FAD-binding oxidoreductase [Novosphingobium mangrovi (ex Huang et al. 2023)]
MDARFDVVIVGAGMAGASLAAAVGPRARVLVIEAEERPGYHTTGRSAAFWSESYGGPGVQPLTTASGHVLQELGILSPRRAVTLGRADEERRVAEFAETYGAIGLEVDLLDRAGIERYVPHLREGWTCAAFEPTCCDIDVAGLHQHYLAQARKAGAELWCRAALREVERTGQGWELTLADGRRIAASVLADAAGAWADPVASMAGVRPLGITPYRRTMAQLAVSPPALDDMPLVLDISETFYFKPESGRLWLSPHDETPSVPCDAAPEELDIAIAIDRFEQVVDWPIARVEHRWAGLRSFAPDRLPVYGFAPEDPAFFWFAGQGGFGIQTAPAAAEVGARLLLGDAGGAIDPEPYAPGRFS